jgi:hypothetical protein
VIRRLRELELPLEEIAAVLHAEPDEPLREWIVANGLEPGSQTREVYLVNPSNTPTSWTT